MKKALLTIALFSMSLTFAKSGEPINKQDESLLKIEKTTKESSEKASKEKITVKKMMSSTDCFIAAGVLSQMPGMFPDWGYCFALYQAGF